MGVKFIHTADLHLKRDEPFRLNVLSWIISKTQELADGLIIAGDLFDSDIEASFLREKVRSILERLKMPVLIIPGNHDYLSYSSQFYYGENTFVFHDNPSVINLEGIEIMGIPFHPQLNFSRCVQKLGSQPHLIIAHGTLYDRKSPDIYTELGEEAKYMPIYRWDVDGKTRYLALGHYHSTFIHLSFNKTEVVYPGSPVATSRRSIGERFVALVSVESHGIVEIERVPVDISPYWRRVEWMVFPGNEEGLLEKIERDIQNLASEKVMLDGKVRGSIRVDETKFREDLRKIEEKSKALFNQINISCEIKHWGDLVESPVLALLVEKLRNMDCDESLKERALELTLSALGRLR